MKEILSKINKLVTPSKSAEKHSNIANEILKRIHLVLAWIFQSAPYFGHSKNHLKILTSDFIDAVRFFFINSV